MVGVPAQVASRRSAPSGPSLAMITFEAKAFATRATLRSAISARTWSMFVRPRVEVWKSSP
jgi:threonine/homoserine efflux transporter RhtA